MTNGDPSPAAGARPGGDLLSLYAACRSDPRTINVLQSYAVARVAKQFESVTPGEAIRLSEALDKLLGD
jgi:hypothetical protein